MGVQSTTDRSLPSYHHQSHGVMPFLKVTVIQHRFIGATRRVLASGALVTSLGSHALDSFESNIELNLRFMIDREVVRARCNTVLPCRHIHAAA